MQWKEFYLFYLFIFKDKLENEKETLPKILPLSEVKTIAHLIYLWEKEKEKHKLYSTSFWKPGSVNNALIRTACFVNSIQSDTQRTCQNDWVLNYITINLVDDIGVAEFFRVIRSK